MTTAPFLDLISLVRRELGVDDVRVIESGAIPRAVGRAIASCDLPGGRTLVAQFPEPPPDVEALQRRLEMICESMRDRLAGEGGPPTGSARPAPTKTLRDELAALAMRAGALVAFVIDAHSPMVWGIGGGERPPEDASDILPALTNLPNVATSDARQDGDLAASPLRLLQKEPMSEQGQLEQALRDLEQEERGGGAPAPEAPRVSLVGEREGPPEYHDPNEIETQPSPPSKSQTKSAPPASSDDAEDEDLVARAMSAVRALPEIETLPRGGHLTALVSQPDFGYLARSFAAIYVLVLVFDGPVDELVARRAVVHALPTIEHLVLSLPPVDPPPAIGGQAVVRRRSRRR